MAGRGKAYRDKRRKEVTAPSGDVYTIRKPGARAFTKQFKDTIGTAEVPEDIEYALSEEGMKEAEETVKKELKERTPEELITSMDALILDCVVDPKVVEHETDDDNELWVQDIDLPDYFFLFREITEFAGVTAGKIRELFRDLGGADRTTSGDDIDVREPTT